MNSRFAVAIHTLAYLAHRGETPASSDVVAESVKTNPVVIRRLIGALRRAGLVSTQAGRGGGFTLARPLAEITLLDIYRAVEERQLIPLPEAANRHCPVGREVAAVLLPYCTEAERAVEQYLGGVTLREIVRKIEKRMPECKAAGSPRRTRTR
jgi:Rrf2 family protein